MPDRTSKILALRIAWTGLCGLVCVVLIVSWVRSFGGRYAKEILVTPTYRYFLQSMNGSLTIGRQQRDFAGREFYPQYDREFFESLTTNAGFKLVRDGPNGVISAVSFSYWLLVLADILMAAIPWISPRFTLRTLLIGTTLVAVILGLIFQQSY